MTMIVRRNRNSGPALGHDAFLDVVANLVAILIILVVVLGSRSKEIVDAARHDQAARAATMPKVDKAALETKFNSLQTEMHRAAEATHESQRMEMMIKQGDESIAMLENERGKMIDVLEIIRAAWAEKQKELDQDVVAQAKTMSRKTVAENELKTLVAARSRLEKSPEPVVAVSHLPTPMAKTVFGEELHFRLKEGRLSVVPIDRLVQEIKQDFRRAASGTREGEASSAVGPIQGYVARYEVNKSREMVSQGGQVSTATRVELTGLTIEPLSEPYGQSLDEVFASNGSQLDIELAGRNPDRTTITVWVYPDSFGDYRRLKEHLYARGYATAARPLPHGYPISGGPQGSRSQAQ